MNKTMIESTLGNLAMDTTGAPVAVAKLNPEQAYLGVPILLQKYINQNDAQSWIEIGKKIDYIYENIDYMMAALDAENGFMKTIKAQIKTGKKLFFKPNLVTPLMLDPVTHGAGFADSACTEWTVIAALMRWFHDKLDISYHQMGIGEAASALSMVTTSFNNAGYGKGKPITTEAVIEGKSGDFYGGWQFYFVRRYLQDRHIASHLDNPMNGHEESVESKYLAPGEAGNRLMVYDLNRIEVPDKGRQVPVPDGVNFQVITIHKAIIGGNPKDLQDMKKYPGCVLINVPKLKMHSQDLITNAIKNLGIGLYPMECPKIDGGHACDWAYASSFTPVPGLKSEIPHTPWVAEVDDRTMLPLRDTRGHLKLKKTGGMPGTQSDIIRAVQNQGIYALHFSDAIEAVNINHTGNGLGVKIPEGLIIVSLDCVALDSFCARYMFKTVPMAEARQIKAKQHLLGEFMHRVPVAKVEGKNIVTAEDVDSPLFHYGLYNYAEKRDVGGQKYYITGREAVTGRTLVSLQGHFGSLQNGHFNEIITGTMYYNPSCFLWDMQKTCFTYIAANDQLFKTSLFKEMMQAFDENGDGMIDYDENGKHGFWSPLMRMSAYGMYLRNAEKFGGLKSTFQSMSYSLRFSEKKWNQGGYDFVKDFRFSMALATAFTLSRMPMENPDPFVPGMIWGNGKWPSLTFVNNMTNFGALYGPMFPVAIDLPTIYGLAFQYADKALNGGRYTGPLDNISRPQALQQYLEELKQGQQPLDFKVFVPEGFGKMGLLPVPNVTETNDPAKIFSAEFDQGKVLWTSDFNL